MGLNEEPPKADDKATKVEEDDSEEEVEADEEEVDFDEDGKTILSCHQVGNSSAKQSIIEFLTKLLANLRLVTTFTSQSPNAKLQLHLSSAIIF